MDHQQLLEKYLQGSITQDELRALLQWAAGAKEDAASAAMDRYWDSLPVGEADARHDRPFADLMAHARRLEVEGTHARRFQTDEAHARAFEPGGTPVVPVGTDVPAAPVVAVLPISDARRSFFRRAGVAAAILLLAGGVSWWYLSHSSAGVQVVQPAVSVHDALPGGNKAMLTLSGGKTIVLDSAANGLLASQGGSAVEKTENGKLRYASTDAASKPLYNTLSTPRGGRYQLTLPDDSRVWLNAASSITYPTVFNGTDRTVTVTGEAYFEIAQNPSQPFRVQAGGMEIQVLGTSFNVNAYGDEPSARTTLVDGRVKVEVKQGGSVVLQPGQAAVARGQRSLERDAHPDMGVALAWREGLFRFNFSELSATMRELSRWYDVDIVYPNGIPHEKLYGSIKRDLKLSEVLQLLERSGLHFTIEGKEVSVTPAAGSK